MSAPQSDHPAAQVLAAIIDSAVDGIIVIDARGRIETFNPAAERLFGYREAEVVGRNVSMLMPSPYREEHDGYLVGYLATGEAKIIGIGREVRAIRRDGTVFPVHLSVGEMLVGSQRKFAGILHDLSERVALEERLRASEERWRSVINSAVDGIIVIDDRGHIEAFNPAAERLFGYVESEVVGRNLTLLMPSPYRDEHDGYLARYLATGEARIIGIGREVTALRRDGSTFPIHLAVSEMTVEGAKKFTGIIHDLSTRVQMEAQLREQATLVRLGEMAAVIAHEIKNPLAGIRGAVQVIGSRLASGSRDAAVTGEIIARIDALNGLIQDLLLFARPPQPHPVPVAISSLIAATVDLLRGDPTVGSVEIEVEGTSPPVLVDPELLKIVLQNLLINSAQAMGGRGRVRIALRATGGRCELRVADSGPGVPVEIRERIFTPFFTTKARGTGLGLPTAKRLIEAQQGIIDVEFPPSGGTAVTVQLPLADARAGV